jgi:hypothetical protein
MVARDSVALKGCLRGVGCAQLFALLAKQNKRESHAASPSENGI